MKKLQSFIFLMALASLSAIARPPIELDYFPPHTPGGTITLRTTYPIYWMWDQGNLTVLPTRFNLELYKGGTDPQHFVGLIAQNLALGKQGNNQTAGGSSDNGGIFYWQAGTFLGGDVPAGTGYCVRAVTTDGQVVTYCYGFTLVEPPPQAIDPGRIRDFLLRADPGCPMCGIFDIRMLLTLVGNPPDLHGNLVLLRDGRQVALLGRLGPGGLERGQTVNIRFAAAEIESIRHGGGKGFVVAIIGDFGRNLFSRPVRLGFGN
jgi:hypothetical protein